MDVPSVRVTVIVVRGPSPWRMAFRPTAIPCDAGTAAIAKQPFLPALEP